jgi:hypothetical protein
MPCSAMRKDCAHYEPVAWWFTRSRLGRSLRKRYEVPSDLPPKLLTLIRKLDAEGKRLDTHDSPISVQEVLFGSARSVAELDAPAPLDYRSFR